MQSRLVRALLILALVVIAGLAVARVVKGPTPVKLAVAQTDPIDALERGGAWYWIERPAKGKARLVRNGEVLYSADEIYGFDTDGKRVLISSKNDRLSSVFILSGTSFYRGEDAVGRPALAGNQVLWATSHEGSVKSATPFAALGSQSTVFAADADGHGRPLASLPESPVDILGASGDNAYALSVRKGQALSTAIYTVPLKGGLPQRVAAEAGGSTGLLRSDGKLFWVADSRDAATGGTANAARTLNRDGAAVTMAEWLSMNGRLFESRGETIYVDPTFAPAIWRVRTNDEYPDRLALPAGYSAFAIGEDQVLLRHLGELSKTTQLYVIPRP